MTGRNPHQATIKNPLSECEGIGYMMQYLNNLIKKPKRLD